MTSIINIPGYFYNSSDFINPKQISKDIETLSGQAIPSSEESVADTIKNAHNVIDQTNAYLQYIDENPVSGQFGTTYANSVATSTTAALNDLIGSCRNSYASATTVFESSNAALDSILYSGQTNTSYNPADKIQNEVNLAAQLIFSMTNDNETEDSVSQNEVTNQVFSDVKSALDSLSGTNNNSNLYANSGSATEIMNATNSGLEEVLSQNNGENTESKVHCHSKTAAYLFRHVNKGLNNIFKTSNNNNQSLYTNSGISSNLLNYVNASYNNVFNTNNGENKPVFSNSRESKVLFDSVTTSINNIVSSNNGENGNVYCNSKNSYQLMTAVNIALAQLFATTV